MDIYRYKMIKLFGYMKMRPNPIFPIYRLRSLLFAAAFVGVLSTFGLTSCSDYLDQKTHNTLTDEQAYGTLSSLKTNAVLSIYAYLGGSTDSKGLQGTNRGVFDMNSLSTDEAIMPIRGGDWYDGGYWERLFTHEWRANEEPYLATWEYLYEVVILANEFIDRVDTYGRQHPEDEAEVEAYRAELRAVRALFYFYLMDLYGNVPLITRNDLTTDQVTQASRPEVFRFIVNELQAVRGLLGDDHSNLPGEYYGRMTNSVATFLLAKLALNAEVYEDADWTDGVRPDGKQIFFQVGSVRMNAWQTTIHYCRLLTDMGYRLEPDFAYNFSVNNEYSKENIFTLPMDPVRGYFWYNYFFRSRHYCHGAALGGGSENGTSATLELYRAMGGDTDTPDNRYHQTFFAGKVWNDGKAVMMDDGVTPLVYYPDKVKLNLTGDPYITTAGARLRKYENDPNANADGRACHNDIVLFRYADALLMKAEAQVRDGESGLDALNEVRLRSSMSLLTTATLDDILHERYVELAWEGWRRNDLVRYGIFSRSYTDRPRLEDEDNGYTTVYPIPEQMIEMHPAWKQNKGYE